MHGDLGKGQEIVLHYTLWCFFFFFFFVFLFFFVFFFFFFCLLSPIVFSSVLGMVKFECIASANQNNVRKSNERSNKNVL